jgi:hypothetical protein
MHRRPLGPGRRLAFVAAALLVLGGVLPWYQLGGDGGLPANIYRAFDGAGVLTFLAGLATLALVALPYAAGDRPTGVDRGLVFGLLAVAAVIGVVLWVPNTLAAPAGLLPDRAYGFWLSVVGTVMLVRAAYEITLEPPRR